MKNNKKRIVLTILTIILGLGISLGAIYYIYYMKDQRENSLNSGLVRLNFTEGNNNINLLTIPMVDDEGLKGTPYTFTIENTSSIPVNAKIKLELGNTTNIDLGAVRYAVFINEEKIKKDYVHDNLILYEKENMLSGETLNVKLYFWVDYYYDKPGKIFSAKILAEGESIDTLSTEPITITLDPDGGTLGTTTKQVYYHQNYGTLPTPTKEGYTFMGWNGKNMFNSIDFYEIGKNYGVEIDNNDIILRTYSYQENNTKMSLNFKANTQYTLSYHFTVLSNVNTSAIIRSGLTLWHTDGSRAPGLNSGSDAFGQNIGDNGDVAYTSPQSKTVEYISSLGWAYNGTIKLSNIQLEEGTVATEYEPYYITSNTKVVQNTNHTLKAIWKENS